MTDEEKAEEYIMREDVVTENDRVPVDNGYGWQTVSFEDEVKKAYLDGLAEGKPKWHDLRKNPNDLPTKSDEYYCHVYEQGYEIHRFNISENCFLGVFSRVIAWTELPRFEEK